MSTFVEERAPVAPEPPPSSLSADAQTLVEVEKRVWDALRTCFDPEIPVNIVDLGLVYECRVSPHAAGGARVEIDMTLTAPACSMSDLIRLDVQQKAQAVAGVTEAVLTIVFDPPWNPSMMTEAARLQLGMF